MLKFLYCGKDGEPCAAKALNVLTYICVLVKTIGFDAPPEAVQGYAILLGVSSGLHWGRASTKAAANG